MAEDCRVLLDALDWCAWYAENAAGHIAVDDVGDLRETTAVGSHEAIDGKPQEHCERVVIGMTIGGRRRNHERRAPGPQLDGKRRDDSAAPGEESGRQAL